MQYPVIGIRPIIDGRLGGVRESLEETTMNMARAVAALYSGTLCYPDGSDVVCVIADTCIGGVAEAAACAEKFERCGVGLTVSVTPCWAYGAETMDTHPFWPKAIWGFNGTERPGAVYLAATLAAHAQFGLPAFGIYGRDVQDLGDTVIPADVEEKLLTFGRAGLTVALMRGRSYLAIGSVSMGIAGSIVDGDLFRRWLGMRTEYVDSMEVLRRIAKGIYDGEEYTRALAWVQQHCREGADRNPADRRLSREQKDQDWSFVIRMSMVIRDLMTGNPALGRWVMGRRPWGIMRSWRVSRVSGSGRIICQTEILRKQS
jgi:L-fucose isomerase